MATAIILVSPVFGVLLGEYNGVACWSRLDGNDEEQESALIFSDKDQANRLREKVVPFDKCETVSISASDQDIQNGYIPKDQIFKYW